MVSANDNRPSGRKRSAALHNGSDQSSLPNVNLGGNVAVLRTRKGGAMKDVTCVEVTDDFAQHVEIRYGEAAILGRLIEDVFATMKNRIANSR